MPDPNKGESKEKFMARCIPVLVKEGRKAGQAVAICSSMYDQYKKHKKD